MIPQPQKAIAMHFCFSCENENLLEDYPIQMKLDNVKHKNKIIKKALLKG